ncbi:MAG TPA: hypothetical protein VIQ99_00395 [Gammaproteobacteria bacterium]
MVAQIRWLRVVILAFLVEAGLLVTALPFVPLLGERVTFTIVVPIACAIVPFVIVFFGTRKLESGHVPNAFWIGVIAMVMYFALVVTASSIPEAAASYGVPLFVGVNAIRFVSCLAGGHAASRARRRAV